MINLDEEIRDIFNCFHDGVIVDYNLIENALVLKIEIQYLAERVQSDFNYFFVTLYHYSDVQIETWPKKEDQKPEIIQDMKKIFTGQPWILSAEIKNNFFIVSCYLSGEASNYNGGFLSFSASSATVIDEAGKGYTIDALGNLSKSYWEEWETNNKNKV